jgi:hypothetical protein
MRIALTILLIVGLSNIGKSQVAKDTLFLNSDSIIWGSTLGHGILYDPQPDTVKVLMLCSKDGDMRPFTINGIAVITHWVWSINGGPTERVEYYNERMVALPKDFIVWQHKIKPPR